LLPVFRKNLLPPSSG